MVMAWEKGTEVILPAMLKSEMYKLEQGADNWNDEECDRAGKKIENCFFWQLMEMSVISDAAAETFFFF